MAERNIDDINAIPIQNTGNSERNVMAEIQAINAPHLEPNELDAELTQALTARISDGRRKIVRATEDDEDESPGLAYFNAQIEKDSDLDNAVTSITMACLLLRDSYDHPGNCILKSANFDQKNLEELLRALFSHLKGGVVGSKNIVGYLKQRGRTIDEVLYGAFDLDDNPSESDINDKIDLFKQIVDRLDELLEYRYADNVIEAVFANYKNEKAKKGELDEEDYESEEEPEYEYDSDINADTLAGKAGIKNTETLLFDAKVIKKMIKKAKALDTAGAQPANPAKFWLLNEKKLPAIAMLRQLNEAFAVSREREAELIVKLNELFKDEVSIGMGLQLAMSAKDNENAVFLLEQIVSVYEIKTEAQLIEKLLHVHAKITSECPELVAKSEPAPAIPAPALPTPTPTPSTPKVILKPRVKASVTEVMGGAPVDYDKFYKELWTKDTPEDGGAYLALQRIYFAMARDKARYTEMNTGQFFNGDDRGFALMTLESVLGMSFVQQLEEAAMLDAAAEDSRNGVLVLEMIAKEFGHTNNVENLRGELLRITAKLVEKYPEIVNN